MCVSYLVLQFNLRRALSKDIAVHCGTMKGFSSICVMEQHLVDTFQCCSSSFLLRFGLIQVLLHAPYQIRATLEMNRFDIVSYLSRCSL